MDSLVMIGGLALGRSGNRKGAIIFLQQRVEAGRLSSVTTTCCLSRQYLSYGHCMIQLMEKLRLPNVRGVNGSRWKTGWWDLEHQSKTNETSCMLCLYMPACLLQSRYTRRGAFSLVYSPLGRGIDLSGCYGISWLPLRFVALEVYHVYLYLFQGLINNPMLLGFGS